MFYFPYIENVMKSPSFQKNYHIAGRSKYKEILITVDCQ